MNRLIIGMVAFAVIEFRARTGTWPWQKPKETHDI